MQSHHGTCPYTSTPIQVVGTITDNIGSYSLSDNPTYATSMFSVIDEMYSSGYASTELGQNLTGSMVTSLLNDSIITNSANATNISHSDITTALSTMSSVTSTSDLVSMDTLTDSLGDDYFDSMFTTIDSYYSSTDSDEDTVADALFSIGDESHALIINLESATEGYVTNASDWDTASTLNGLAESYASSTLEMASTALASSDVGESYSYSSSSSNSSKVIEALKFDTDDVNYSDPDILSSITLPTCGTATVPLSFLQDGSGTFDCSYSSTSSNLYTEAANNSNRSMASGVTSVSMYGDSRRRRRNRRRLSEETDYESDYCNPYLFTIDMSNVTGYNYSEMELGEDFDFPSCDYWSGNDSSWNSSGCFVYNISNSTVCVERCHGPLSCLSLVAK